MTHAKSKRPSLSANDVRELLRVLNELHALPSDPLLRKTRLPERPCRLVRAAWVYGFDLPLASPEVASLPPRQRQTLQLLLAGHGEKQAASQLQVSTNTVHHYVKAIYRHFGVNSRSELLAKWVKGDDEG